MITPSYVRTMAAYNVEMNRRLYANASNLSEAERRADRAGFWHSIHGTLVHGLWGDFQWMSRFDGWAKPAVSQKDSPTLIADFGELKLARVDADERISRWAERVSEAWLAEEQVWFSASVDRQMRQPRSLLVTHFFNHQTHHRGQAHAMITACGERTGDTDLFLLV